MKISLIVLDSVGVGASPDAGSYGDAGSHTLRHIFECVPEFDLPNLRFLGLGNIDGVDCWEKTNEVFGSYGRASEFSQGKDTTTGHWEIAGLHHGLKFPYFPNGFPKEIIDQFEARIGMPILGNIVASGTVIIDELGKEHQDTGRPIVYTSSDSVFQIAMHEEVIPLSRQYEICEIAREILVGDFAVGRVIGRPFVGSPKNYQRTANRRDYSIEPPGDTLLDLVERAGLPMTGVGKIKDIFAGKGVVESFKSKDNAEGIELTIQQMREQKSGLLFTNLVDFDMLYGHRRDPEGYAKCLMEFDRRLPEIISAMQDDDILILTADHGNDPTHPGTDHTREYIPILMCGRSIRAGINIGTRKTFADIGATIAEILGIQATSAGTSFYDLIRK